MATTTSILWTLLPNGGKSSAYLLSIYVAPRLTGAGPTGLLKDYDLDNWTKRVMDFASTPGALRVELGPGGPKVDAKVRDEYLLALDPGLWDAIFPADRTKVTERVFQDHSKRWIRSFSVRPIESYVQGLYNAIADASPSAFPDLKGTTPVTELTDVMDRAMSLMRQGLPRPRDKGAPKTYTPVPRAGRATHPDSGLENNLSALASSLGVPHIPLAELFRAYRFYRRGNHLPYMSKPAVHDPSLVSDPPEEPEFDFHQAMAALGDHPFLLRKLGLVIDCVLPIDQATLVKYSELQLVPLPEPPLLDITPWTRYLVNKVSGFRPMPRKGSDLGDGMLLLNNKEVFDVIQTDPDGNVLKVMDYAVNMSKVRSDLLAQKAKNPAAKSSQKPEETSLPALRSGGLMVTRLARDNKLWDHLALQSAHEANPEAALLHADDVLRGYRLDVNYKGRWHSLCRWQGDYDLAGIRITQAGPDEGYLKADSASSDPEPGAGPQKPDLYLHETLVNWRNWSLVARQPGKTIVPVRLPDKRQRDVPEHVSSRPGAGFEVATDFRAEPLSLPPLRFGETYRLRARAVDLAGNSFAPPPSPKNPAPKGDAAPAGVGESTPIRYLRYDPVPAPALVLTVPVTAGESLEVMVIRSPSTHMPEPLPAAVGIDPTALYNPTNARWLAAPKTTVGDAEAHGVFDALFRTPDVAFGILERESGSFDDPATGAQIVDIHGADVTYPPVPDYVKGDPLPDGMYFLHREDPVALPYLPDPLAHGFAMMPLQHDGTSTGVVLHREWASTGWPDAEPVKLLLGEEPGAAATFELGSAPANVRLPRGTMLRLRYASAIVPPDASAPGEIELMGRWHGMSAAGRNNTKAHGYQHWMLTPWRTLTLVHAVEKPMAEPKILKLAVPRAPGDTFVYLTSGTCEVHSHSTGELEVRARWEDPVDDPLEDAPRVLPREGHVIDRKVDYEENPVLFPTRQEPPPKHELGDTKHRFVNYRAVGTTRYREYFPPAVTSYEDPVTKQKLITVSGPELEMNVLSSARPLPPNVLYIVPTFKWTDTPTGRKRTGRGLRIYLQRGWFSSGADELLGVVLLPPGPFLPSTVETYREYVSLWGSDPIFDTSGPSAALNAAHFTFDPAYPDTAPVSPLGQNLLLAERNLRVDVLGFTPEFDADRKLWFVDLELLPTNAYYTFVRFALCRYQPDSLPDLELSRVVRAEFAQLIADRTASLSYGTNEIDVTLSGPSALSQLGQRENRIAPPGRTLTVTSTVDPPQAAVARGAALPKEAAAPPTTAANPGPIADPGAIAGPVTNPGPVVIEPALVANPAAGAAHLVIAQIESRPADSSGDLGWQPIDGGTRLASYTSILSTDIVHWRGTVRWRDLPRDRQYRLVLREFEIFQTDADVAETSNVPSPTGAPVRSRLVYVDMFPLANALGLTNG